MNPAKKDTERERRPAFDLWRVTACYGTEGPRVHDDSATLHWCACCSTVHSSKQQASLERFSFGNRDEVKNPIPLQHSSTYMYTKGSC